MWAENHRKAAPYEENGRKWKHRGNQGSVTQSVASLAGLRCTSWEAPAA